MLQGDGHRQVERRRQVPFLQVEEEFQAPVQAMCRQACGLQQVVIGEVFAAVHGLLANKTLDLLFQRRVIDALAVVAHAVHEKQLALGKTATTTH